MCEVSRLLFGVDGLAHNQSDDKRINRAFVYSVVGCWLCVCVFVDSFGVCTHRMDIGRGHSLDSGPNNTCNFVIEIRNETRRHTQTTSSSSVIQQCSVHLVYAMEMTQAFFRSSRRCDSLSLSCSLLSLRLQSRFQCPRRVEPAFGVAWPIFFVFEWRHIVANNCRAALIHNSKWTTTTDRFVCQPPDGQRRLYFIAARRTHSHTGAHIA